MPGDNAELTIELNKAIALEERSRFAIREGNRTVGAGIVTPDRGVTDGGPGDRAPVHFHRNVSHSRDYCVLANSPNTIRTMPAP